MPTQILMPALSPTMEETLRAAGRRGDIIRSMEHAVGDRFSLQNLREFSGENMPSKIVGCVLGSGAVDDAQEKRFLAVEGVDGNQWYVELDLKPGSTPPAGTIVEISKDEGAPTQFRSHHRRDRRTK